MFQKQIKQTGKEEIKPSSLFVDDMTVQIENPEESTKKLLQLINGFSKVARYKVDIHNNYISIYLQ